MEHPKNNRNRNTALVLIGVGLFLLIGHQVGFFTIVAIILIGLGVYKIRNSTEKSGYILLMIGVIVLIGNNFTFIVVIVLISLGYFIIKSRELQRKGDYVLKQKFIHTMKWDKEPWLLKDTSIWFVVGEVNMDLSLAILEEEETTVILQGVIGDVDVIVPEGMGVLVSASVLLGSMDILQEKETGLMNKIVWQSENYDASSQKVKIELSYLVGDINLRVI